MKPPAPSSRRRKVATAPEVLLPALRVDANYLHGLALNVRTAIQAGVLPALKDILVKEAQRGQMETLFIPEVRGLDPVTCCEALQPELHRLGMKTEIVRHTIPRLGLVDEKTALVVSWRELRS